MLVLAGCFGFLGNRLSTFSVHDSRSAGGEYLPLRFLLSAAAAPCWARRREEEDENEAPANVTGAASYSRYSSQLQDERSIADQQRKCRDRARSDGYQVAPQLEFTDEATSGAKLDRVGFEALMSAARAGMVQVVYFENLSRLARDCVLTLQTLRELVHERNVRVVSIDEGIDSAANDSWELLAAVLGMQNEQYLRALGKFVFRGQEGGVLDGLCVGDYCFGYGSEPIPGSETSRRGRNPKPKKRYIIAPENAAWVKVIFDWFVLERRSMRWIVSQLNKLGAPKDHRATTTEWRHQLLYGLLTNRKYIGEWSWGKMKNVRRKGKVRQEPRPASETEKYQRQFPELRIVDDEIFGKAQQLLAESRAAFPGSDRPKGKLNGATTEASAIYPRHLLSKLVKCGHCGRTLYVGGQKGRYLFCHGYKIGKCDCQTTLRRDLAEQLILEAVGDQILADPELVQLVFDATQRGWDQHQLTVPTELKNAEAALAETERKIESLLDRAENGDAMPELEARLAKRRAEREMLRGRVERLRKSASAHSTAPTMDWVEGQLANLRSVLFGKGPAAAIALRNLIGPVVVTEMKRAGRKRHYLRGEFHIRLGRVVAALGDAATAASGAEEAESPVLKTITIDFRQRDQHEELADDMKADFDAGMPIDEILKKYQCSYTVWAKAWAHWHESRGLPRPDSRAHRGRLKGRRTSDKLGAEIMRLWDEGLPVKDISQRLDCGLESVRQATIHPLRDVLHR